MSERQFHLLDSFGESIKNKILRIKEEDDIIYQSDEFDGVIKGLFFDIKEQLQIATSNIFTPEELIITVELESALSVFLNDIREQNIIGYLCLSTKSVCDEIGLSFQTYGMSIFCSLYYIMKKFDHISYEFFLVVVQPILTAMRLEDVPKEIGKMGGRPEHPRKEEALKTAMERWSKIPYASLSSVATYVKSKLEEKYTDAPKLPSIKSWLNKANLKPVKK
ncbi:hypothetical protein [Morganella morganii]|uniref:hypothetical protein n=1 Tax=Morganella morganii TaxID=582 RepID=UPI000BBD08E1|nr:hypothetical protein [Morganella morganii]ATF52660.1 hypothetical protein CO693_02570 [Morganella morganii]